jgi:CRISPR/Cas system CSM-associated protein Csm3 (group 7 of RAMP superfamily)
VITLKFAISLHTPFLVSSGQSGYGLDAISRADSPLPASSLKGVMRASAAEVLGLRPDLVAAVFGQAGTASGWAWTDATPRSAFVRQPRSRNRIDPQTGVARREALATVEEVWATSEPISFLIEQVGPISNPDAEVTILIAAAHAVTGLGSWRNRGAGAASLRIAEVAGATQPTVPAMAMWVLANRGANS